MSLVKGYVGIGVTGSFLPGVAPTLEPCFEREHLGSALGSTFPKIGGALRGYLAHSLPLWEHNAH
jgi:hypothetical protein